MECNKDEALRTKSIAEEKFSGKDFLGAKRFALKAQKLNPGLDGISEMLMNLDVFVSAENKVCGETDWYSVLGVNPSADNETIQKQHRKLALMLHPDKNKSLGAEGAFQLISKAFNLLSDKQERLVYTQRRDSGVHQRALVQSGGSCGSVPSQPNKNLDLGNSNTSVSKPQNDSANVELQRNPTTLSDQGTDMFWTVCCRCNMNYRFHKTYLSHNLRCSECKHPLTIKETSMPFDCPNSSSHHAAHGQQQPASSGHVHDRRIHDLGRNEPIGQKQGPSQDPLSGSSLISITNPDIAAKAASVVTQAPDNLRRSKSHASWRGNEFTGEIKVDDDISRCGMSDTATTQGNAGSEPAKSTRKSRVSGNARKHSNSTRKLTPMEIKNMLVARARKEISDKLNQWKAEAAAKSASQVEEQSKRPRTVSHIERCDQDGCNTVLADQPKDASMSVPDPDFHDFDQDRTEASFADNEVWAAYDDHDGMPRFYAMISKVVSRDPFKLKIGWLESRTNTEFGSAIDWVGSGFYKTCGAFRTGKYEICKSFNSFSQKMNWSKGPRGSILILPTKGDVWALYKNWSPDWNELTPDEVVCMYEMAMVLDDCDKENGISVAPLSKVVGFKTVFRRNADTEAIRTIPREEVFRFSHRVPNHVLTGLEAPNAPKGYVELDPAATPLEFLRVITEETDDLNACVDREHGDEGAS